MSTSCDARGHVVWHTNDERPVEPHRVVLPGPVAAALHTSVHRYEHGFVGPLDHPRRVISSPVVRLLDLFAVADFLLEQAEFVVDPVAEAWHSERREGIQEARGQPAEPAVTECGIDFALLDVGERDAVLFHDGAALVEQPQVREVIDERSADEEFH
jgi:hypothetical protein